MTDLTDHITLVTGASRGLGRAIALALGRAGAQVIAVARTSGALEELDDAIRADGGQAATLVPLDIADDPALERLGAAIHERWGRLDIWVHAAIHAPMLGPAEHIDAGDLDRALAINPRATQRLIRVLDPLLRQSALARAVFFSDPGMPADAFHGAYRASKAGQAAIVDAWARGIARTSGARVLDVAPPPMRTALRARFYPGEDTTALARPADVAAQILTALEDDRSGALKLGGVAPPSP